MYILISVLILIASVLMILIVLVQNSKGGGLASNFSSSNQIMGVRKTSDFLEKATWALAIAMVVLSVSASMLIPRQETENQSVIRDQVQTYDQNQIPVMPSNTGNNTELNLNENTTNDTE